MNLSCNIIYVSITTSAVILATMIYALRSNNIRLFELSLVTMISVATIMIIWAFVDIWKIILS